MAVHSRFQYFFYDNGDYPLLVRYVAYQGLRTRLRARRPRVHAHRNHRIPYVPLGAQHQRKKRIHTLPLRLRHQAITMTFIASFVFCFAVYVAFLYTSSGGSLYFLSDPYDLPLGTYIFVVPFSVFLSSIIAFGRHSIKKSDQLSTTESITHRVAIYGVLFVFSLLAALWVMDSVVLSWS